MARNRKQHLGDSKVLFSQEMVTCSTKLVLPTLGLALLGGGISLFTIDLISKLLLSGIRYPVSGPTKCTFEPFDPFWFYIRYIIGAALVFAIAPMAVALDGRRTSLLRHGTMYFLFSCTVYLGVLLYYRQEYSVLARIGDLGFPAPSQGWMILGLAAPACSLVSVFLTAFLVRAVRQHFANRAGNVCLRTNPA